MHHTKKRAFALAGGILASGLLLGSVAVAAPSAEMLSNTCAGCHGPDGVSAGPAMPTIAGQPAGFAGEILNQYRTGERHSTIMTRIAKGYTEEQLNAIAGFYGKLPWKSWENAAQSKMATPVDEALAKAGAALHKKAKCSKCHEEDGRSTEDDTPRIAGQWVDYLIVKFEDYKNPDVDVPQPKKMAKSINKLSMDDLKALAHFYASQK